MVSCLAMCCVLDMSDGQYWRQGQAKHTDKQLGEFSAFSLFSTSHPRPIDAWTRIGVAIYALHGDSEGWKAISRPLGHNIAQARAVRNG